MSNLSALKTAEQIKGTYVTVTVPLVVVTVTGTVVVVVLVVVAVLVLAGCGYLVEQNDWAGG